LDRARRVCYASRQRVAKPSAARGNFAAYFSETKNAKTELFDTSIKVKSPSVTLEIGTARVVSPDAEPSETIYTAIHVKTAEGWKIDCVREETPAAPAQRIRNSLPFFQVSVLVCSALSPFPPPSSTNSFVVDVVVQK
jgi:hypothetical protein